MRALAEMIRTAKGQVGVSGRGQVVERMRQWSLAVRSSVSKSGSSKSKTLEEGSITLRKLENEMHLLWTGIVIVVR